MARLSARFRGRSRQLTFLLPLLLSCPPATPAWAVPATDARGLSAQLDAATARLRECSARAEACDAAALPTNGRVEGGTNAPYTENWSWLGDALSAARTASAPDRRTLMDAAEARLALTREEIAAAAAGPGTGPAWKAARPVADAVLRRPEFREVVSGPGWLDRQLARLQDALFHVFVGVGDLGRRAPWLAPALEWLCFGGAAAGLLWFFGRGVQRETLHIAEAGGGSGRGVRAAGAEDWAARAQAFADAQAWREALHCLFWAAVATLEDRRAWKPNRTRTPREYLRLLPPGTEAATALRALLGGLERVWYGGAGSGAPEFQEAQRHLETLASTPLQRSGPPPSARATLARDAGSGA